MALQTPAADAFDASIERRNTGSSKWSRYAADVLPLWVADMDFAVAPAISDAIAARADHSIFGYAVPDDALRGTVVTYLAACYDWHIDPAHIVFLPGVEAGFNMALRGFLAPGDGVAVHTPIYRPILNAPGHWGLQRNDVFLQPQSGVWQADAAALDMAFARSRAFLFCNPHNPTGKVFSRAEVEALATAAVARDMLVIADEIHCDLLYQRPASRADRVGIARDSGADDHAHVGEQDFQRRRAEVLFRHRRRRDHASALSGSARRDGRQRQRVWSGRDAGGPHPRRAVAERLDRLSSAEPRLSRRGHRLTLSRHCHDGSPRAPFWRGSIAPASGWTIRKRFL